ncbi:MAG TPA: Rab family GTPase [Vicinamibacterales bacterium]|nr:Rab family GTPase [Vicinamibacterales bacterium]
MIQKKICMLGGFGVGKTSLVSRFVHSIFSDKYLTTVGVKIEKKSLQLPNQQVDLIVWDLHGEDEFQKLRMSYLRGSAGYLLVVDATRPSTLDTAIRLHATAQSVIGRVPVMLAVNKSDLEATWDLDQNIVDQLGCVVVRTSAKTGTQVEETFLALARAMIEG